MIRFVDLGYQLHVDESDESMPRQFAFFNTIPSQFVSIEGYQVFDSFGDFAECCAADSTMNVALINRLIGLMPDWAKVLECSNPRSIFHVKGLNL